MGRGKGGLRERALRGAEGAREEVSGKGSCFRGVQRNLKGGGSETEGVENLEK